MESPATAIKEVGIGNIKFTAQSQEITYQEESNL